MRPAPAWRGCRDTAVNRQKSQMQTHWGCVPGWPQACPGSQPYLSSDHLNQVLQENLCLPLI